jgi:hypothetical protein
VHFDIALKSSDELFSACEACLAQRLTSQNAKPDLDLIQPRRVSRSKYGNQTWVSSEEPLSFLAAVRGSVVQDKVEFTSRIGLHQFPEKANEGVAIVFS